MAVAVALAQCSRCVCRPTPIVKWIMAGRSTAFDWSRIAVADYGMTLRFSSVQFEDQGGYECQGRSDSTQIPVRIVFHLNVQCTPCQSYSICTSRVHYLN